MSDWLSLNWSPSSSPKTYSYGIALQIKLCTKQDALHNKEEQSSQHVADMRWLHEEGLLALSFAGHAAETGNSLMPLWADAKQHFSDAW